MVDVAAAAVGKEGVLMGVMVGLVVRARMLTIITTAMPLGGWFVMMMRMLSSLLVLHRG